MTALLETRNADLQDLRKILEDQHARKIDLVTPATNLRFYGGRLVLEGLPERVLTDDGFMYVNGAYRPTATFDAGLADKLKIPLAYVRRMRAERTDLYDANANGLIHGSFNHAEDPRSFMVRLFRGDDGEAGVARAILSDKYAVMDNLDALVAALDGIRQAGIDVQVTGCDLSESRMYVRLNAPFVTVYAEELLRNYRSPFTGALGADNPVINAGLVISNSEVGGGAFGITPRMTVQVCNNGMTITKDAVRQVHLGGKLDHGIIQWSADTERKNIELVTAKARDAVQTFLNVEYMGKVISEMTEAAAKPVKSDTVMVVGKKLAFTEDTIDDIFTMFVNGGDMTAGGVMQAVTAAARNTADADKAHELENSALKALELAASA